LSGTGAPQARRDDPGAGAAVSSEASRVVMEADQIARACARIAHQILEANRGAEGLVLMGSQPWSAACSSARDGDG
jgi:pyrimidine operon attenuation protein/uracil phosphoribosyltransferase